MIFPKHGMKEGIHMARSKLTKEVIDELVEHHSKGVPIKHACALVGISKSSYYNWISRGKSGDKSNNNLYIELNEAMNRARAMCVQHYLKKAWENPSPQLLIFLLRVYDPDTFNVPFRSEQTQKSYHRLEKLFDKKRIKELTKDQEE